MPYDDSIATLKNSIKLYEKELQEQTGFLKKLRQPENKIEDLEIAASVTAPSVSRLFDIYDKLLCSYREYSEKLEKILSAHTL